MAKTYPSKYKDIHETPQRNRNQSTDANHLHNTAPGVPAGPEAVNFLMKGRIPMTTRLGDLVLDEHQFLELEDLRERHETALAALKNTRELNFANGILEGKAASRAYLDAGYLKDSQYTDKSRLEKARLDAAKLRKREHIAEYISSALQITYLTTMQNVQFSHHEWLQMQREVLEMALGRKPVPKAYISNGEIVQDQVRDAALGVASRTLEILGKHYGWLKERMELEGGGPMVMLKDFTGMAQQLSQPAETQEGSDD